MLRVLELVEILPLVSVSVPFTPAFAERFKPEALLTVRCLKEIPPVPPIVCDEEPLNVNVLVEPAKEPLFVKSPCTECENELASNESPKPMETLPPAVIAFPAVAVAEPDIEKFPASVIAE